MIGRHALEATDRDGFAVDATASTGGLAWAIARASENARKDVGFAIEQVGLAISSLRDEADVLGDVGVGGTRPLAVDNLMVVLRIENVGGHAVISLDRCGVHVRSRRSLSQD